MRKSKSLLPETVYTNPQYAVETGVLSVSDLRKEYTRLRDIEVKRVKRLQDSEFKSKSVKEPKKLKDLKTNKQLYKELSKLYSRVSKRTSSVSAKRKRTRALEENLKQAGLTNLNKTQMKQMIKVLRMLEAVYKSKYNIYDVVNIYEDAKEQGLSAAQAAQRVLDEFIPPEE